LTHNIEAYLAKGFHPICDGIALEGVRLIAKNLEKAVKSPLDLEARGAMLMASMMGAIAFQKGLGLTHSAAHALSTVCDTHHGLANALMIESCMKFNQPMVQEKFKILEQVVGCEKGTTFLEWLGAFKKKVGLPSGLKEIGVTITDQLIDIAFDDPCHPSGPKPVTKNDFKTIYQESL